MKAHTDFNERSGKHVFCLAEHLPMPEIGFSVTLEDGDGNTCRGTIERVKGGLVYVLPEWKTWQDGET